MFLLEAGGTDGAARERGAAKMGIVVEFRPQAGREQALLSAGQSAEIVIFPGVRMERWPESPAIETVDTPTKQAGPSVGGKGRGKRR
ncbi:MAG: hypothetical protein R3D57_05885 [Hyphomicrobiaceae bacterium]